MGRGVCRWRSVKERLRLKGIGCCGGRQWDSTEAADHVTLEQQEEEDDPRFEAEPSRNDIREEVPAISDRERRGQGEEMNLAAALAAERQYSGVAERTWGDEDGAPMRVSLMRLLEEGGEEEGEVKAKKEEEEEEEEEEGDAAAGYCCVCMGRRKGAAFIPCGHTFCRICSRDLWLNRRSCPLCNRPVLEILDIF